MQRFCPARGARASWSCTAGAAIRRAIGRNSHGACGDAGMQTVLQQGLWSGNSLAQYAITPARILAPCMRAHLQDGSLGGSEAPAPAPGTPFVAVDAPAQCLPEEDGSVMVRDDLDELLRVLPADIRGQLINHPMRSSLLEVVLDLGRRPEARFLGVLGGEILRDEEITWEDLKAAQQAVGEFGGDNRAGVQGTLHRISALRNRKGHVVGLTCRVGRAVTGHMDMIRDMIEGILFTVPNSILFLGRPGVGKTTVIREMARVLSDTMHKRVVIVDTSNEIGGDGDVPHPAIGGARRMQVPDPSQQHRVMVEAVENHMPEVVIVDEIGTEAEALACRSIAERGVQLVGTAHGQLLENLIKNPTLSDLIGGICSVTLGDEEARARGTQKSILERKAPPTFPLVIEMRERACWVTHWVEDSVDCLLHGKDPIVQLRQRIPGVKDVAVTECRYEELGSSGASASNSAAKIQTKSQATAAAEAAEAEALDVVDPAVLAVEKLQQLTAKEMGYPGAAFGATFDSVDESDPYAWAQRLRDIPDKDALQELAQASSRGYVANGVANTSGRRAKFTFTQGTGGGKRNGRNASSRNAAGGSRRRV